jgi:hypothetical protein
MSKLNFKKPYAVVYRKIGKKKYALCVKTATSSKTAVYKSFEESHTRLLEIRKDISSSFPELEWFIINMNTGERYLEPDEFKHVDKI